MRFTLFVVILLPTTIHTFSIANSAKSAMGAAKKFLAGTRKAKSTVHQTPLGSTSPGAVSVSQSGESGGIMKKSVDFLTNGALIVGGIGSIYNHFAEPATPVSISRNNL